MIKLKTRRNKMPAIMLSPMIDMMFLYDVPVTHILHCQYHANDRIKNDSGETAGCYRSGDPEYGEVHGNH